jgi:hypothetical protein
MVSRASGTSSGADEIVLHIDDHQRRILQTVLEIDHRNAPARIA